jgi:hypothetical protein
MPAEALLRLIKNCRLYQERETCKAKGHIPHVTRGLYVLYKEGHLKKDKKNFEVTYIGIGGVQNKRATSGVGNRIRTHYKRAEEGKIEDWTHYSFFEVHDNISREEIRQLESLLLTIFQHDKRITLDNVQHGGSELRKLSKLQGKLQARRPAKSFSNI